MLLNKFFKSICKTGINTYYGPAFVLLFVELDSFEWIKWESKSREKGKKRA